MLPNLGGLARTSGNAAGKRPAKAGRAQEPEPELEPPPLRLTGLPRDVIDVLVTQAALDARDAADPVGAICAWMKSFCKAAKVQGVAGCEDRWYKLALQALGVPPDAPEPAQLYYPMRYLFASVCEDLHGPNAIPIVKENGLGRAFRWNASQRELDWELVQVFESNIRRRMLDNRAMTFDEARDAEKASWEALGDPDDPRRQQAPSVIHSLAVLFVLKGGEPWADKRYRALDNEIYTALERMQTAEIHEDEALRLIRDALDRGAQASSSGWSYDRKGKPIAIASTLQIAVETNAGSATINLLLDRGATTWKDSRVTQGLMVHPFLRSLAMELVEPYWSADQAATERLIEAARPIVRRMVLLHDAAKLNVQRSGVARMSGPQGPPADWLTAAWKRLFDVTQWMDPRELEEHLPQMVDYDPTAWPDPA